MLVPRATLRLWLLALALPTLAACGGDDECEFNSVTRDVGGSGLVDCGIAHVDDTGSVDRCAVTAFTSNNTFRALYEQEDGDLLALVHAAGDTYHLLRLSEDGRIEQADCSGGSVQQEGTRSFVRCDDPSNFELVCE
jgi:hypothetical protein